MNEKQKFYSNNLDRDLFELSDKYGRILEYIVAGKPGTFLDIGCADGSFAKGVHKATDCDIYGVEISSELVKQARQNGLQAEVMDLDKEKLPFATNKFDFIFCGEIIEHVYSPEHLLQEISRVLKPKGKLMITTPNLGAWFNRISLGFGYQPVFTDTGLKHSCGHLWPMAPMGHIHLYTLRSLKQFLGKMNFRVQRTWGQGINNKVGFGKHHPRIAAIANFLFRACRLMRYKLV